MNASRSARTTFLLMLTAGSACAGEFAPDLGDEDLGSAEVALASVPGTVACVHIVAGGVGRSFPITPGAAPLPLALGQLPVGAVAFSGAAYDVPCPSASAPPAAPPSWLADEVVVEIVPGLRAHVDLEFRRHQGTDGSADFQESALVASPGGGAGFAVLADGTLAAWGTAVGYGELGTGVASDQRYLPVAIAGPAGLLGVKGGGNRACAWSKSQLWCWGAGPLGDGQQNQHRHVPTLVPGVWSGVTDVTHSANGIVCVRLGDGRAYCWGSNGNGQLARPAQTAMITTPVEITGLRFRDVATAIYSTCGAIADGRVYCWGDGSSGQLGDGTTTARHQPMPVSNLAGAVAVAGGMLHHCAVRADGTVWCWGYNFNGQLGDGTTMQRNTPVQVIGLTDAIGVVAGQQHTCALRRAGQVVCWGQGSSGQLGTGTGVNSSVPVLVPGLADVVSLEAYGMSSTTCAVERDGEAWCWGLGTLGQIGDGQAFSQFKPTRVGL